MFLPLCQKSTVRHAYLTLVYCIAMRYTERAGNACNRQEICRLFSLYPDETSSFRGDKRMSAMRVNLFNAFIESTAQPQLEV